MKGTASSKARCLVLHHLAPVSHTALPQQGPRLARESWLPSGGTGSTCSHAIAMPQPATLPVVWLISVPSVVFRCRYWKAESRRCQLLEQYGRHGFGNILP